MDRHQLTFAAMTFGKPTDGMPSHARLPTVSRQTTSKPQSPAASELASASRTTRLLGALMRAVNGALSR